MKKYYLNLVLVGLCALLNSCGSLSGAGASALVNGIASPASPTITIDLVNNSVPSNNYSNLTKGLNIEVSSEVSDYKILDTSNLTSKERKYFDNRDIVVIPTIKNFVNSSMTTYARSMGIGVGRDVSNDLILQLKIKEFKCVLDANNSGRAIIEIDYTLLNSNREIILHQVARGRKSMSNSKVDYSSILDQAYTEALKDMDWNGIANYLKINDRPDQEQSRTVKGEGDTALEHTIIRWYVVSAPAGADVYWRIVSSTPEVKNTNSAFLGSTPYEATESFSVRGLNFENSGNVQVEIVCEKPGYITQSRRFNLRQAIEQREISTKFNLIKDE